MKRFLTTLLLLMVCLTAVAQNGITRFRMNNDLSVDIRSDIATNSKVVGYLWKNDEIDATGITRDGRYIEFEYKGQKAYVQSRYFEQIEVALNPDGTPQPARIYSAREEKKGSIPMFILSIIFMFVVCIPLLAVYVAGFANLFFFIFKYQKLREFYNKRAGADFMPPKRMSKMLLTGLIPLGILTVVTLLASFILGKISPDMTDFGAVVGLIVSILYVIYFAIPHKAKVVGKKQARWETLYPVVTLAVLIPIAILMINVMVFLLVAIPLFYFVLTYVLPGAFSAGAGAAGSVASGVMGASAESEDSNIAVQSPYNGDDGGILEGTTRVPLRDNGDGTMSDNRGHLYKKDGDHVRRLS